MYLNTFKTNLRCGDESTFSSHVSNNRHRKRLEKDVRKTISLSNVKICFPLPLCVNIFFNKRNQATLSLERERERVE